MNNLQEFIERIERQHKSKIKVSNIFCEVDKQLAKFYLEFCLESGDYEDVCIKELKGENLSCDDVRIILAYNDFVNKYTRTLAKDYNIECHTHGIYDNQILKEIYEQIK